MFLVLVSFENKQLVAPITKEARSQLPMQPANLYLGKIHQREPFQSSMCLHPGVQTH